MKWIVGLDTRADCRGALFMAAWLDSVTDKPARQRFVGVHVVERALRVALRDDEADEITARALEVALGCVREIDGARFAEVQAVPGQSAEGSLDTASEFYGADALLIGRHGPRDGSAIVRLGRVARRLLRKLPSPVLVVPPDLERDQIGAGPILAATDLGVESIAACRFALELARQTSRDLEIVNVVREPEMLPGIPSPPLRSKEENNDLDDWVREHGLGGAHTVLDSGDPLDRLLARAERKDVPIVVCGSRHLSLQQRLFQSSLGTDLARTARCGVLVVPPEQLSKFPG